MYAPIAGHQNPDGATICENCSASLAQLLTCPSCGATVRADASFCGQCGFNLKDAAKPDLSPIPPTWTPESGTAPKEETFVRSDDTWGEAKKKGDREDVTSPIEEITVASSGTPTQKPAKTAKPSPARTIVQTSTAHIIHLQTDTILELPSHLSVVHLGKPNDRVPPDIDVSGFPNSDIVSRVHADIRMDAGYYYLEDTGSTNGTYANGAPLLPGNRHRLRNGDRISLGKGDLVTFLFRSGT